MNDPERRVVRYTPREDTSMGIVGKPVSMLLVEDDPADVTLIRKALAGSPLKITMNVVKDGIEAMAYLRREAPGYLEAEQPDLILLDLNLPRMDGREVLTAIKSVDRWRSIPVVVLTTSKAREDVARSYDLGANCYVTKPVGLEPFIEAVKAIELFWLNVAQLPHR